MVYRGKCDVCGCTGFKVEDGYYYCTECNTQNVNVMEMEVDAMDMTMGESRIQGVKLKKEKLEKAELTSWEEYNYILLGLVNEAIDLGAPVELKKTVLQLWTRYLQRINAAFFTKTDTGIPKLPARYFKQDAQILYNTTKKRKIYKSSRSSKSTMSQVKTLKRNRVLQMARAKMKKALMKEQMELSSNEHSNMDSSMTSMSSMTKSAKTTIPLQYTSSARRSMKRRMPKQHIKKHSENGDLECHKSTRRMNIPMSEHIERVSKPIILGILYIGLNQTKSDIQLCDLVRFLREGHISIYNIAHFFPENLINERKMSSFVFIKGIKYFPAFDEMLRVTGRLCEYLHVPHLLLPDMPSLVHRYIREMCLPVELEKFLERLVTFCPPEMKQTLRYNPNYAARAMAYVIFGLKWFFGLDGVSEGKMSESAQAVNELLKNVDVAQREIFNWNEWVEYIEMRKVILTEYHMPTNVVTKGNNGCNTQRYADFLNHCKRTSNPFKNPLGTQIYNIYQKLSSVHDDAEKKSGYSFHFPPSLTPSKSYMASLTETQMDALQIPEMMLTDHSERSLDEFLRPRRFRNNMASVGIKLCIQECPQNMEVLEHVVSMKYTPKEYINVEIVENEEDEDFCGVEYEKVGFNEEPKNEFKATEAVNNAEDLDSVHSEDSLPLVKRKKCRQSSTSSEDSVPLLARTKRPKGKFVGNIADESDAISSKPSEPNSSELSRMVHGAHTGKNDICFEDSDIEDANELLNENLIPEIKMEIEEPIISEDEENLPIISEDEENLPIVPKDQENLPIVPEDKENVPYAQTQDLLSFSSNLQSRSTEASIDILPEATMDPGHNIVKSPRRNLENITMFDDMSDADDEDPPEFSDNLGNLNFYAPHYMYWHYFPPDDAKFQKCDDYEKIFEKLPPSFMWLLNHCAIVVETSPIWLYRELLVIEKQFMYHLLPLDQMTTTVKKRNLSKDKEPHPSKKFKWFW